MKYALAVHKDPESTYGVTVPDVPGCFSGGDTMEEAIASAEEAIVAHLTTLLEQGMTLPPPPQPIEAHMADPEYAGAIWALAEVDPAVIDPKPERINVSMPRFVLAKIDQFVAGRHETRSGFLARAAIDLINRQ